MQKNMETLNKMNIILDKVESALQSSYSKIEKARIEKIDNKITPTALQERGFKFTPPARVSGADMWQGMAFWINDEKGILLRGNISTAKGGTLHLAGHYNLQMDNLEELDALIKLFK